MSSILNIVNLIKSSIKSLEMNIIKFYSNLTYTPLAKLLARQARPGTTQDGSGNKAENYSSISAANQHQLRQKMYHLPFTNYFIG